MKKIFLLLIVALFSASISAEKYTIVFNSNENGDGSSTAKIHDLVYSATNNCVDRVIYASKVARAKPGFGIKGGVEKTKGELRLGLDGTFHITTMTIYAASYIHKADSTKGIIVCGEDFAWQEGHRTEIWPYTITLNKNLDSITIVGREDEKNRWYVQKIEFEAENPHPSKGVIETRYATLKFEPASWYSEDEPMEDALDFEVVGKNIDGDIDLTMKTNKSKFTVMPTNLTSLGGEASISYSITMSSAPSSQISYKDTIIVTATGTDAIIYTCKIPVELTIKPQSSGASTFVLDTTRMAIGPMPGDYYKYAQGTVEAVLKNHLSYIICTGQRYRYGSGSKKSWDAFFHTDRDTVTNQVLDMYSNNVRYFDPEKPTASVKDFDIEHMLPKSWWGGDVNPAYCDIFHLVPGDYSANRSKSNHAPGIPADSTFNNGSFVTGSGAAYGLTRVFCPADEYKGDFARAYFYIACCYGDSLTWVETGEPGIAMTNEGWEEFRPWLRDLLLEWHRLDPVSKKELDRAIEVNKIQGNRNPFIDYPELVEYIWGNKRGTAVDFKTLNQSYGDQYSEGSTDVISPNSTVIVRKEFQNGQVIIIRNGEKYTLLGQPLQ